MQNLCKRVISLEIYVLKVVLQSFVMFFRTFVFERSSKLYLCRGKIITSLLVLRVFKKKKYLFRVSNPTAILV